MAEPGRRCSGSSASGFRLEDVLSYKPDVTVDRAHRLVDRRHALQLLPTRGGETDDALLMHMPEQGVLFVGDILMPYLGAPFSQEGSVDGLLAAIDQVHALKPRLLLHGHEPLTRGLRLDRHVGRPARHLSGCATRCCGDEARRERGAIQQANLVPPTLEAARRKSTWPICCCART